MAEKNFAPPDAHVADIEAPAGPPPRPVVHATILLWIGYATGFVLAYWTLERMPATGARPFVIGVQAVFMALIAGLYVAIYRGRNWARIVFVLVEAVGVYSLMRSPHPFGSNALEAVGHGVGWLTSLTAMVLLFAPAASRDWFARKR